MDAFSMEIGIEDLISRIPGLFAYLKWNDDGSVDTCVATDSPNGCYGKIVDNIYIPVNVRLTNYVQVLGNEIPDSYLWNDNNTIKITENEENIFSTSASLYLRKTLWYEYIKTDEVLNDAVEYDNLPSYIDDNAPEHIKMVQKGMDGISIICNGTELWYYYEKAGQYTYYERKDIITPCTTYSYRTLIYEYYKYRNIVGKDNSFIKFIENGIGLLYVNRKQLNLTDLEKYPDVPENIYLSQVNELLSKYKEYQTADSFYRNHFLANGKTNEILAEKSKQYVRMGGDNMTNWLQQILQKAYDVANEYKCHADNKDFPLCLNTNIMLNSHTDIVGLSTVMENEFVPGNRYYDGDLLTYNGRTYMCMLDVVDKEDLDSENNYRYILKNKNVDGKNVKSLLFLNNGSYILVSENNIGHVLDKQQLPTIYDREFLIYKDVYYKWNSSKYVPINVVSYCTGVKDKESGRYVFDEQHFVLLSKLSGNKWYDDTNLNGDYYRFFEKTEYIPSTHTFDYVMKNNDIFGWDEEQSAYLPIDGMSFQTRETTDSKLRSLRCLKKYVNPFGDVQEPDLEEDWLFYYKVNTVTGLVVETDDYGNIIKDTDDYPPVCFDLHAYGNIITGITYDSETNRITFNYVMGAHLLGEEPVMCDMVDGVPLYCYNKFIYDTSSIDGIRFSETYNCIGTEIAELGDDFNNYVNGDIAVMENYPYKKFPFKTIPVTTLDNVEEIKGNAVVSTPSFNDLTHLKTVQEGWMVGLYYQPKLHGEVLIDRGNGASFERHIRLGEIRSMEDLEQYQNGGFYQITEN